MKREDKCISLELAKQIDVEHKRLGIEVESEYNWDLDNNALCYGRKQTEYGHDCYEYIPAYDVAELGEMLPRLVYSGVLTMHKRQESIWSEKKSCECCNNAEERKHLGFKEMYGGCYCDSEYNGTGISFTDSVMENTEAEARGKMYLWLLREGHITEEAR